ncbi:phosphotransferase [Roseibium sp. SCPC15]|uniref:phosphotransferase n=1 Tax=Roseibium sp. SCP15 TaxID=3141376 RepID=UPI003334FAAD
MSDLRTTLPGPITSATASRSNLMHQIQKALKSAPLLVNGYAMIASTGLTSAIGIVFWMAATRFYDQSQVGLGAALIALMTPISYFGQMNLGTVLNRFLPTAGHQAGPLILKAYVAAGLVSGAIALGFALGVGTVTPALALLRTDPVTMAVFVSGTVIWTIFALQDAALSGLRLSVMIPFENTVYALLKIAFLVGFAFVATMPVNGIFLGWTIALIPIVLVINVLIFRHLAIRKHTGKTEPVELKSIMSFLSWDYAGSIFLTAGFGLAPLMIASTAGVEANAPYHIAWTFTYSVYLIGRSMGISLLAESAAFPQRIIRLTSDAFCHTMLMMFGAVTVIWIGAPYLLKLFGAAYVTESTSILRVLILSCLPWAATTTFIAALRAKGRTQAVAILQFATLVIFTASSALLLQQLGALGVAYGWLIAHSLVLAGFLALNMAQSKPGTISDITLLLAASLADIAGMIKRRLFKQAYSTWDIFPGPKSAIGDFDLNHHDLKRMPVSVTDSTTLLLTRKEDIPGHDGDIPEAVVKYATTRSGIAALQRNAQVLRELHSDHRVKDLKRWFPEFLGEDQQGGFFRSVETALPGEDGRAFFGDDAHPEAVGNAAVTLVTQLHANTAERSILDQEWADRWIDAPIKTITTATRSSWGYEDRAATLECLREDLRRALIGRQLPLGRCHGDLCPGNVLLTRTASSSNKIEISGLVDWDNSKTDAPLAVDLFHLAVTTRMLGSGEELGQIARTCILESSFEYEDILGFSLEPMKSVSTANDDRDFSKSMFLLTWLHHIKSNLTKSERYPGNWLWMRANVDRVLTAIAARTG